MASTSPMSADAGAAVALRGVAKHYGAVHAVDGVDLDVQRGEVFGLIGHNGAGKSTLFKMMLGLVSPSAGDIRIQGAPVSGRGFRDVRRGIGYLPENVVLYDNLDGLETLRFFARLKGAPLADCEAALQRVGLNGAGRRPVREYSKGMRQRLGFAQALLGARNDGLELVPANDVQAVGGLVEQQHRRERGQCEGHGRLLLLAQAHLAEALLVGEFEHVQVVSERRGRERRIETRMRAG